MRYVVTDAAGVLLREGSASNVAAQAGPGEIAYEHRGYDGGPVTGGEVKVADGAFVAVGDYAGPLPGGELVLPA